jgi:hypothetical protein
VLRHIHGIIIFPEEAQIFIEGGYDVAEETHDGRDVLVARRSESGSVSAIPIIEPEDSIANRGAAALIVTVG